MQHKLTASNWASKKVREVMNRDPVCISSSATMAEASAKLAEHGFSAAPVVDEAGKCVGWLSDADFTQRELRRSGGGETPAGEIMHELRPDPVEGWRIEDLADDRVSVHMTTPVQSVLESAPAADAAAWMVRHELHRLPVLNEHKRPVGVVSTIDILRAALREKT